MEAAARATIVLEDAGETNAGFGSNLTESGTVEMDAGLMDGCGSPNPKNCYEQTLFSIGSCPCLLRRTGQRLTNSCLDCYISGVAI